jgi:hypothetical protein
VTLEAAEHRAARQHGIEALAHHVQNIFLSGLAKFPAQFDNKPLFLQARFNRQAMRGVGAILLGGTLFPAANGGFVNS